MNENPISITVDLKNVGIEPARFIVKLPKLSPVAVSFKHGPVAPGMSVKLNVQLKTGNRPRILEEVMTIVSETEILTIPILANII
jgi:Flagellar-associated PapD-like